MALALWNVLAAGKLRTDAEEQRRRETGEKGRTSFNTDWERTPLEREMSTHLTTVAIACVMQKAPYVFPVVGGCKVEYLEANIDALKITLTPDHIKFLESNRAFRCWIPP
ncbi:hypothetical protein JVU11DRAFT_3419 [Chiua virens]|nr:hypothetical protein JVU11DRAFT_3419 [Chiua virens]